MGYWDATDRILRENGGRGPECPECRKNMYPMDDHGRFFCECGYRSGMIPGESTGFGSEPGQRKSEPGFPRGFGAEKKYPVD